MERVSPRRVSDRKGSQLLVTTGDFLVKRWLRRDTKNRQEVSKVRRQALKLAIASATIGALTLLTAGTALAAPGGEKGPAAPVANMGLGIAVNNVIANAANKGANVEPDPGLGTHLAVGVVMQNNPALDVSQPPFS